jgi:hypothetical protein
MLYNKSILLLALSSSILLTSAINQPKNTGIDGYIFRISGNRMPSPNLNLSPPRGIKASLYIYELTSLSQVTRVNESAFYSSIHTKLVQTVSSNDSGYFFVSLPPGEYSVFSKKDALFYANNFDGENHIAPVKVLPNKVSRIHVNLDYDASY